MKRILNNKVILIILASMVMLFGCQKTEDELSIGDDYTLSTQQEVDNFKVTDNIRTLTISGTGITSLSSLQFKSVKNLIIEQTGLLDINMTELSAVTVSFVIRNNDVLTEIKGLNNLKFINGMMLIENNPLLINIQGLLNLKIFKGDLTITGNISLGENTPCIADNIGFCVIKYLMNNSIINGIITLSNNHPGAVSDPVLIGEMGTGNIISYVLGSKTDVDNFTPLSDTAQDLRITGMDINDAVIATLKNKLKAVKGVMTLEGTAVTNTESFFNGVKCLGSIILKNNPELFNPQGFVAYTAIGGDLIIENCPKLAYWGFPRGGASFSGITRIEGNFKINPASSLGEGGAAFASLTYVGGSFEITGDKAAGEMWNMDTWYQTGGGIKHIGGDLIYKNHYKVNGLGGFENVEHIGGDVFILDNGGPDGFVPILSAGTSQIGFCIVKKWINNGVLKKTDPVIQLRVKQGDALLDIGTLPVCN